MFWLIGLIGFQCFATHKRDWHQKSIGRIGSKSFIHSFKRFFKAGVDLIRGCIPVTWWVMHNWLQDFAYRINIQWWVFALAGIAHYYRINYDKLPGNKSGDCKPGEVTPNGVTVLNLNRHK